MMTEVAAKHLVRLDLVVLANGTEVLEVKSAGPVTDYVPVLPGDHPFPVMVRFTNGKWALLAPEARIKLAGRRG